VRELAVDKGQIVFTYARPESEYVRKNKLRAVVGCPLDNCIEVRLVVCETW
jgi:hypothetical protein